MLTITYLYTNNCSSTVIGVIGMLLAVIIGAIVGKIICDKVEKDADREFKEFVEELERKYKQRGIKEITYKIENSFGDIVQTFTNPKDLNEYQEKLFDIFECVLVINVVEEDTMYLLIRDV